MQLLDYVLHLTDRSRLRSLSRSIHRHDWRVTYTSTPGTLVALRCRGCPATAVGQVSPVEAPSLTLAPRVHASA